MYNKFSLLNEEPFIFYKFHNLIIYLLVITQITSCTNLTPINSVYKKEAFKVLIQKTLLQINEIYSSNEPIHPPSQSEFPLVKKLPGSNFKINPKSISTATFDPDGKILLSSGDYTIPVMTYCMKQSRSSPNAHTYRLSQLKGKRSSIIRDINSKALLKFSAHDIQILSWSLQAGLKYEELTQESKRIIDEIVPYAQAELKESLIETIEKKWNKVSDTTVGMIPSFDQSSEDLISELGELGQKINKIRLFK